MIREELKNLNVGSAVVIFDRDFGSFFFQDFRGYGNLLDDAEWLLERTQQRSWGFIIRPISRDGCFGLWIGEYGPGSNRIIREEMLFDKNSSNISKNLFKYAGHEIEEEEIAKRIKIDYLKKKLSKSNIIRDFKHYICPEERFYKSCPYIEEIYRAIKKKYGTRVKISCSKISEIISSVDLCHDVVICPLTLPPNATERIINLNKALRSRGIGEIKIVDGDFAEVH